MCSIAEASRHRSLRTPFSAQAFRFLQPTSVLVMNVAGDRGRYAAHLEKVRKACPGPVDENVEGGGVIDCSRAQGSERLLAGMRAAGCKAFGRQRAAQGLDLGVLIIHDQEAGGW
jgi:hypothetical protein